MSCHWTRPGAARSCIALLEFPGLGHVMRGWMPRLHHPVSETKRHIVDMSPTWDVIKEPSFCPRIDNPWWDTGSLGPSPPGSLLGASDVGAKRFCQAFPMQSPAFLMTDDSFLWPSASYLLPEAVAPSCALQEPWHAQ